MTDSAVLRRAVSDVLGEDAEAAILAPGALVGLRLFLRHRGTSVLLLSDREYYGPEHFPGCDVHVAPFDELASAAEAHEPDVVLASLVSWRGEVGDVEALCRDVRGRSNDGGPLVCVDWCHAGALGFPPAADLDADLIIGDVTKWLTPAATPDRLAFLLGREALAAPMRACFGGLHSSGGDQAAREARWVDPQALAAMADSVKRVAADRSRFATWYADNMTLARVVGAANGVEPARSAILWFPGRQKAELRLDALPSTELAWDTGSGVRVLCQASP